MYFSILLLNRIWFGMAFCFFSIYSQKAMGLLLKKEEKLERISENKPENQSSEKTKFTEKIRQKLSYSLKFLGGMNFAFCLFNILLFSFPEIYPTYIQKSIFLLVFGVAHASQFIFNVPIARNEWVNQDFLWHVWKGKMFFIFVGDFSLMCCNVLFSVLYFLEK